MRSVTRQTSTAIRITAFIALAALLMVLGALIASSHDGSPVFYRSGPDKEGRPWWRSYKRAGGGGDVLHGLSTRYRDGDAVEEMCFENGALDGWKREFDAQGRILMEALYRRGSQEELVLLYDEGGALIGQGRKKEGKRDGPWVFLWPNGILRSFASHKDGKFDGVRIEWDEAGTRRSEGRYLGGEKDGTWRYFTDSGVVEKEEEWNSGKRIR